MRRNLRKLLPTSGPAYFLHRGLVLVLPAVVFVLIRLDFAPMAALVIILSKWRMFSVRPRFWPANIRANAVDLMVGLSVVLFMVHSSSAAAQILYTALYGIWLLYIKPKSSSLWVMLQAFIGQFCALMALYLGWGGGPVAALTLLTGLFCYLAARHFFDLFDEPYARLLAYLWGYFGAALAWALTHWLLFYQFIAQPTLILTALGYGLATLYYLDHVDRLNKTLRNQVVFIMVALVFVVLVFSDWGNKIV